MTRPNLSPQLAAIIRDAIAHRFLFHPFPDFDADTELDAIADSLDRVSIAMDLEETFGIDLPTVVVNRWRTVGDVEASLRAVLAQAGSAAA